MVEKLSNLDNITQQVVVEPGSNPHSLVLEPAYFTALPENQHSISLQGWAVLSTAPGSQAQRVSIPSTVAVLRDIILDRPICNHEGPLLAVLASLRTCGQVRGRKEALTFYSELHT